MALDPSLSLGLGSSSGVSLRQLFGGADGFWFDFVSLPTGAAIASVSSLAPGTGSASQGLGSTQPNWNAGGWAAFDGIDDNLLSNVNPTTSVTLGVCARINSSASTKTLLGSQLSSSGRIRISLNGSNQLAAGVGAQTEANILAGGASLATKDFVSILVVNATTVELWLNGVLSYSGAISGAPNTSVPFAIGANNAVGSVAVFAGGRIYRVAVIQAAVADSLKLPLQRALSSGILTGF